MNSVHLRFTSNLHVADSEHNTPKAPQLRRLMLYPPELRARTDSRITYADQKRPEAATEPQSSDYSVHLNSTEALAALERIGGEA